MGKASKWFSTFLTCNSRKPLTSDSDSTKLLPNSDNYAIKVVGAEAAFLAAKAPDEVSRLVYKNVTVIPVQFRLASYDLEKEAAVKIQSVFRGYLARKALRALKGLVRIQALWRGHFVRKQSTDMLRRLQALVRVQHRALANRALNIESTHCSRENSTRYEIHARSARTEDLSALKRIGSITSIKEPNWLQNWVEDGSSMKTSKLSNSNYDEKSDKILKIDNSNPRSRCLESSQQDVYNASFATSDYLARYYPNVEEGSESARRSPKTPLRDYEGSRSLLSGSPSPNFMANTKSSRAKAKCHSVPRQREDQPSCKRSLHVLWELKTSLRRKSDSFY